MALGTNKASPTTAQQPTPRPVSWRAATFDAFQVPAYRVVWLGTILAFLAFMMSNTAQGVVAFDLTGSNRAVGLVAFGQGISQLILNPFGGAIADRFSKRMLILIAQLVIGSVMLVTGILIAIDAVTIAFLALGAFIIGCMFSFLGPTRTALLGEVVGEHQRGNAMALLQVGSNFARISAPFVATALLAWPLFGAAGTYFVIAGLFVMVFATYYRAPKSAPVRSRETSVMEDIGQGMAYVRGNPKLLHQLVSFHLVTVIGLANYVIMPGFAKDTLHAGTTGLGLLLGVMSIGGFAMSLVVASLADSKRAPMFLTLASFGLGLSLIALGLMPNLALALVVVLFVGGASSAFQTLNNAVAIRLTDLEYFGRVISLMFLAWGLVNIASLPVGYLADVFGERAVLSGSGIVLCVVVTLLYIWRRRIGGLELP